MKFRCCFSYFWLLLLFIVPGCSFLLNFSFIIERKNSIQTKHKYKLYLLAICYHGNTFYTMPHRHQLWVCVCVYVYICTIFFFKLKLRNVFYTNFNNVNQVTIFTCCTHTKETPNFLSLFHFNVIVIWFSVGIG